MVPPSPLVPAGSGSAPWTRSSLQPPHPAGTKRVRSCGIIPENSWDQFPIPLFPTPISHPSSFVLPRIPLWNWGLDLWEQTHPGNGAGIWENIGNKIRGGGLEGAFLKLGVRNGIGASRGNRGMLWECWEFLLPWIHIPKIHRDLNPAGNGDSRAGKPCPGRNCSQTPPELFLEVQGRSPPIPAEISLGITGNFPCRCRPRVRDHPGLSLHAEVGIRHRSQRVPHEKVGNCYRRKSWRGWERSPQEGL